MASWQKHLTAPKFSDNPLNTDKLDSRLNAYREDLADERLKGKVKAQNFVRGIQSRIIVPVANLYKEQPHPQETKADKVKHIEHLRAGAETQLLYGAEILIFERRGGYAWIQAKADSYVGYVEENTLLRDDAALLRRPTHRITVPRSFLYSEADLRSAPTNALSMGSLVYIAGEEERRATRYAVLESGEALIAAHLKPLNYYADDYVTIAETLLNTPYLWGGTSAFGIDCSGLVQLAMAMTGRQVLRDSDMQAATIGKILENTENFDRLQRGDLVFWRGHVAILYDKKHIIHANGGSMSVAMEPLAQAISRIAPQHGKPLAYRRP